MDFGELEAVVAKALAKESKDRYADAEAMTAAIDAAMKKGAARVFARAVPQAMSSANSAPQVATPSGWNVPSAFAQPMTEPSSPLPPQDSLSIPQTPPRDPSAPHEPAFTTGSTGSSGPAPAPISAEPTAQVRAPSRKRPLSNKQLAIAGGALAVLVIVIAIVAGSHKSKSAAVVPAAQGSATGSGGPDPIDAALAHATELAQSGDGEAALQTLLRARKQFPDNAPLAVAAGKLYFNKLWWTDGIKSFRDAVRIDPSLKSDADLIKTVLRGFNTTPDVDDRIESFLREDIGEPARPYLEETAKSHPNKQIRARAAAELRRFH